jgi:manganese/zinc/iron transport system permease protein
MVHNISSPVLVLLAAFTGVFTVFAIEALNRTGLVKEDTAIGLVFPALFSLGVILITRNAGDVHLDTDAVLVGDLAFAPFDRLIIGGKDAGPKSMWVMGGIFLMSLLLLIIYYKEIKISTFDAGLASSLGFSPVLIHYALMTMTSITTVGAFDAVGAVLVVALMIVPAASAYLLTEDLRKLIIMASIFGVVAALSGYWTAHLFDVSISGAIASMLGLIFMIVYFFAPEKGLVAIMVKQKRQKREFYLLTFLLHLSNHESGDNYELNIEHLTGHFKWNEKHANEILQLALQRKLIDIRNRNIALTADGRSYTREIFGLRKLQSR